MIPILGAHYTCPNSGLIVQIARIRYRSGLQADDYSKVWIRYFIRASGRLLVEERSVKLIHKNIQHWERVA